MHSSTLKCRMRFLVVALLPLWMTNFVSGTEQCEADGRGECASTPPLHPDLRSATFENLLGVPVSVGFKGGTEQQKTVISPGQKTTVASYRGHVWRVEAAGHSVELTIGGFTAGQSQHFVFDFHAYPERQLMILLRDESLPDTLAFRKDDPVETPLSAPSAVCNAPKWQRLVEKHRERANAMRNRQLPAQEALLWQPQGRGNGGLAWELRHLLLAYLEALVYDQTLVLHWPPYAQPYALPISLPSPAMFGPVNRTGPSSDAHDFIARSAIMDGAQVFQRNKALCWQLGVPYAPGPPRGCTSDDDDMTYQTGLPPFPPWFSTLQERLSGDSGLPIEKWLGCAFEATIRPNAAVVQLGVLPRLMDTETKTVAIHIRTGAADHGDSFDDALDAHIHRDGLTDHAACWDGVDGEDEIDSWQRIIGEARRNAPTSSAAVNVTDLHEIFLVDQKRRLLASTCDAVRMAIECATTLTQNAKKNAPKLTGERSDDSSAPPVRWVVASDSSAVRTTLARAAARAGADHWTLNANSTSRTSKAAHHTKRSDLHVGAEGDVDAIAEFYALGEADALVATYSSVVPSGSNFAHLAALRGDVPLVFVRGPQNARTGTSAQCSWSGDGATPRYDQAHYGDCKPHHGGAES